MLLTIRKLFPFFLPVFVVTDGLSNVNAERTIPEAEAARAQGIHVIAIGVGLKDTFELDGMASKPLANNVYSVNTWDDLWNIQTNLIGHSCRGELSKAF